MSRKRILIISNTLPFPPDSGEKNRIFHILKNASKNNDVYLISFISCMSERNRIPELLKYCTNVETVLLKKKSKLKHLPGVILHLLSGKPLDMKFAYDEEMAAKVRNITALYSFDAVQIEHSFMASYIKCLSDKNIPEKILVFHNVGSVQYKRLYDIEKDPYKKIRYFLNWLPMRNWEAKSARDFSKLVTTSKYDSDILKEMNPRMDITVVPNGVDTSIMTPELAEKETKDILYIGKMDYAPNIDGLYYFYEKIYPLIRVIVPECRLYVVGGDLPERLKYIQGDANVIVTGYVDDVRPIYRKTALSVVPLRAGSGTRTKILESMALGRTVVSTSLGCEGLGAQHGINIYISDSPGEFARYVVDLVNDNNLRQLVSSNARNFVEENYNWNNIGTVMNKVYGVKDKRL